MHKGIKAANQDSRTSTPSNAYTRARAWQIEFRYVPNVEELGCSVQAFRYANGISLTPSSFVFNSIKRV